MPKNVQKNRNTVVALIEYKGDMIFLIFSWIRMNSQYLKLKKKVELVLDKSENSTYKWVSLNDVNKYEFYIRDEAYKNRLIEFFKLQL